MCFYLLVNVSNTYGVQVRRGPKTSVPENGSARVARRASSDSASRDRRDAACSRQNSRGPTAADQSDSDRVSPSTVAGGWLLPDERDDSRSAAVDSEVDAGTDAGAPRPTRRNVDDTEVYKVLVLGSQGVGKTTLVEQLMTSEYLANQDNSFFGRSHYCFHTSSLVFLFVLRTLIKQQ